jgi:hypothetical protein
MNEMPCVHGYCRKIPTPGSGYVKVFEPAVLAAMQKMQASLEELRSGQ